MGVQALQVIHPQPEVLVAGLAVQRPLQAPRGILAEHQVLAGELGEFLLVDPQFERIVSPMIKNLSRLGIKSRIRIVDSAQYQNRLDQFDFDIVVSTFGQSLSPGNEQIDFWHSSKAEIDGSRNIIGVKDPVVDELIDLVINAPDRASLIARTRALDRVLLWGHYVIPQWHIRSFRVAYWNKFSRPKFAPKYGFGFDTWWVDPAKAKALEAGVVTLKKSN